MVLDAVVQVALDATAFCVHLRNRPPAGASDLRAVREGRAQLTLQLDADPVGRDDTTETIGDVVEQLTAVGVQTADRGALDGERPDLFLAVADRHRRHRPRHLVVRGGQR